MTTKTLAVLGLLALTACNTVAGFGRDVNNAGTAIHNEARETQGACVNGALADGTPCRG